MLGSLLCVWLAIAGDTPATASSTAAASDPATEHTTTVTARAPVDIDDGSASVDASTIAPEDALLRGLGATLVHQGGPLAPSRALVRGLGGARLRASIDGLSWGDPATGLWDAASLPWGAADDVVVDSGGAGGALGGGVRVRLSRDPGLRARLIVGSLTTLRGSFAAVGEHALVAADVASTAGDFSFRPSSALGETSDDVLVRNNNDQRRVSAVGAARIDGAELDVDTLVVASGHTGGVPGFATSPTRDLRGEEGVVAARLAAERTAAGTRGRVAVQARAAHRATFGPSDARSVVESGAGRVEGTLRAALDDHGVALPGARLDVTTAADHAALVGPSGFSRTAVEAGAALLVPVGSVRVRLDADVRLLSDIGPLVSAGGRAEIGDLVRGSLGVVRTSRAPTLDELYAPRGLVLGDPTLRAETTHDVELAVAFVPRSLGGLRMDARAVAFAGVIDDGIVYVNKNAYEIGPTNLGRTWRAGVDVAVHVEPHPLLGLETVASLLASRVEATHSPLPLAPGFSARTALRFGFADGLHGVAALRSRGEAASNAFGTLKAAPYSLVDLSVRAPLAPNLVLGVSLDNALDALDARDANLLPLPGRLVFFSLEVRA